ncbi:MAG: hypothetical protein ACE141_12995 [Bryobacteraceae bacterium]
MTVPARMRQLFTVARLEARRAFFSRRALWVYVLALFPAAIFFAHGVAAKVQRDRLGRPGITASALLDSVQDGESDVKVVARLGRPYREYAWERRGDEPAIMRRLQYFDGRRTATLVFKNGELDSKHIRPLISLEEDRQVFAAVFQHFYLRLAILFGCLGIFLNLFRGKMMDRTLHYWLLAPLRREVLLGGKYLAGLIASSVIFAGGAILAFYMMLWPQQPAEMQAFWQQHGLAQALAYAAAAVLACIGYGSVFLAAGLLVKNPIIPAAVLLLWEGVNPFLPNVLQKISVLYYVQALCPVPPPINDEMPAVLRLLFSPAAPPSKPLAVFGLLAVTALVLWLAARAIRKLEINYSTD